MSLFVSAPPNTTGVFAMETPAPASIAPVGTGVSVIVGQFPWGPANTLTYPSSLGEFYQAFAPKGSDRTGSAYLSVIRKAWPVLGAIRVVNPSSVAATAHLAASATNVLTVTAAQPGTLGNSIVLTVGPADDGVSDHFNLTAALSGASGTTVEVYRNVSNADSLPDLTRSVLLASVTSLTGTRPDNGNTVMGSLVEGTSVTVTATHYTGTAGQSDYGFAKLEQDDTIAQLFTDDAGSLRGTVNAGLYAHCELLTNRVGFLSGASGQSASAAQTDVANYRSKCVCYVDPWVYVRDDTTGALQLVPGAPFAASVAAQTPPSLSIAWRELSGMLSGIASLEVDRGTARGQNTASGITTLIRSPTGGYTFEVDVNTSGIAGETDLTRTRIGQYIAKSVVGSWQPFVNGPNVPLFQNDLMMSLDNFLSRLKSNKDLNPAALPYISDFLILPPGSANTNDSIGLGDYTIGCEVRTGAQMKRIFLSMQYSPTVQIVAA